MKQTLLKFPSPPTQISAALAGRSVNLHGLTLALPDLCGATIITGTSGSGKTETIVNPLAAALAAERGDVRREKSAIIYFAVKGQAHHAFVDALPEHRKRNVVVLGPESSGKPLFLFSEHHWRDGKQASAAVDFLLELMRHASNTADETGNHKAYFDGLLRNALRLLAEAAPRDEMVVRALRTAKSPLAKFFSADAVSALVYRLQAFIAHLAKRPHAKENAPRTEFEKWCEYLDAESTVGIQLLRQIATGGSEGQQTTLLVELQNLLQVIHTDSSAALILDRGFDSDSPRSAWSFERVIDEGKILIIDMPLLGGADANRTTLLALAFGAMAAILRRKQALSNGTALNSVRPVVLVADEFHTFLCSKGRHEGLDVFLSRCREFGAIVLLATQSIPLLHSVYRDSYKTESLLSHMRNHFFGYSVCPRTNEWVSNCCGLLPPQPRRLVLNWHRQPEFDHLVTMAESPLLLVPAPRLLQLPVGAFYVRCTDGKVFHVDARRSQPAPVVREMLVP